ncbi:hypothetical protein GGI07_001834 [Coemansia sp. Benny D115]|nr:hypothetical protein GGI07_001834 [Coemansia sp. Benny D115]
MADDDWQTVPEKPTRRPQRGAQGGYRNNGGYNNSRSRSRAPQGQAEEGNWRTSGAKQPSSDGFSRSFNKQGGSRSRSRPPAQPQANAQQFKLDTNNKFELHVGKGSRARHNDELREFFETRDDEDSQEETFDAIDDDDLAVSDYESEDDENEATEFAPMPVCVRCTLCPENDSRPLLTSVGETGKHLKEVHRMNVRNLSHLSLTLQEYLDAYAAESTKDGKDAVGMRVIDPATDERDREIRDRIKNDSLDAVLAAQAIERRGVAQERRKCLFCKHVCENRADLFRHGYREHNFNIGLPDNLVGVSDFLHILESKLAALQCLYCEKTFTSPAVLRKHMRKKKHFKISAHNRLYDRFYVVNYAEPGKSWEALENEAADSDAEEADRKDDSWEDWQEKEEAAPAKALFDLHECGSAEQCWAYMKKQCGFDIHRIRQDADLDFYRTVALINHIRRCSANNTCFACQKAFASVEQLVAHVAENGAEHLVAPAKDSDIWEDKDNLKPVIENDPLLMAFDDAAEPGDDEADESASKKRLEESKKILRKQFENVSLDDDEDEKDQSKHTAAE